MKRFLICIIGCIVLCGCGSEYSYVTREEVADMIDREIEERTVDQTSDSANEAKSDNVEVKDYPYIVVAGNDVDLTPQLSNTIGDVEYIEISPYKEEDEYSENSMCTYACKNQTGKTIKNISVLFNMNIGEDIVASTTDIEPEQEMIFSFIILPGDDFEYISIEKIEYTE